MTALAILLAMTLGVSHGPKPQACAYTVSMIALSPPPIMSGNLRTTDGGCVVWMNLSYASALRRRDVCQLAAHEAGHLAGLPHSADPTDLMFSPFRPSQRSYCR